MDSGKQGSPDSEDQVMGEATKRTYECTFCKRGFTNAQALGGHMNIHRKDRPNYKGKQASASSVPIKDYDHDHDQEDRNLGCRPSVSSEPARNYPFCEAQRNYHMYFQPPAGPSPRSVPPYGCYYGSHEFLVPRSHEFLGMNEELCGANLSLQIGSTHVEDMNKGNMGVAKEDELDLELRLGHHP
ncbi:hypothetical protein Tsubulata_031650 [Turnera subulata]|uniref:C2H2-type domain-containing protein n=1 Tax=Turnera subulata TaxID=218843 RepID=A0A9Q0GB52_9ROSI|nr:hypothetical protein Tsubulata_031650 [Turnera subulata]